MTWSTKLKHGKILQPLQQSLQRLATHFQLQITIQIFQGTISSVPSQCELNHDENQHSRKLGLHQQQCFLPWLMEQRDLGKY